MSEKERKFGAKEKEQRDLESGDNPEERARTSRREKEKTKEKGSGQRDLESGDNPSERERTSNK